VIGMTSAGKRAGRLAVLMIGLGLVAAVLPASAGSGRTPQPQVDAARGGACVLPPEQMRRQHMDLLKHQRKVTVHEGVRGAPASLVGCIDCHASRSNDSVLGSSQNFCQGCHSYAAVKLDCFECHNPRTGQTAASAAASAASAGAKP